MAGSTVRARGTGAREDADVVARGPRPPLRRSRAVARTRMPPSRKRTMTSIIDARASAYGRASMNTGVPRGRARDLEAPSGTRTDTRDVFSPMRTSPRASDATRWFRNTIARTSLSAPSAWCAVRV